MALQLRVARHRKLSAARRRRWSSLLAGMDEPLAAQFVLFLGEVLELLTGQTTVFSGHKRGSFGIGEESWDLVAGTAAIRRHRSTELEDGWQRVEVLADSTIIHGLPEGRSLQWDGEYDQILGLRLALGGLSTSEVSLLETCARELFEEVEFRVPKARRKRG